MRKHPGEWDCREPNTVPGQDSVGHKSIPQLKGLLGSTQFHSLEAEENTLKQRYVMDWNFSGLRLSLHN